MANRPKQKQYQTPFGEAGFCSLIRPNFKFQKQAGEFNAQVIVPLADAQELVDTLDRLYEQAQVDQLAAAQMELDAKAAKAGKSARKLEPLKRADKPYAQVVDPDTGEKLPLIRFGARLRHRVIGKDDTGKEVVFRTVTPTVLDAKLKPVRQEVGAGSLIRIAFTAGAFFTPAVGCGLSLRLIGVQVKQLVQPGTQAPEFEETDGFEEVTTAASPIPAPEPALTAASADDDTDADADY